MPDDEEYDYSQDFDPNRTGKCEVWRESEVDKWARRHGYSPIDQERCQDPVAMVMFEDDSPSYVCNMHGYVWTANGTLRYWDYLSLISEEDIQEAIASIKKAFTKEVK